MFILRLIADFEPWSNFLNDFGLLSVAFKGFLLVSATASSRSKSCSPSERPMSLLSMLNF